MRHFKPHKIPEESYNPKRERRINSKLNCLKTSRHGTVISRIGGQLLQRAIVVQIYDRLVQFKGTMSGKTTIEIWKNCHHKLFNLLKWTKKIEIEKKCL